MKKQKKRKQSEQEDEEEDEEEKEEEEKTRGKKRRNKQIKAEPALRAEVRKGVQRVWVASVWLIAGMPLVRTRPRPSVRSQSARPRSQKVRWAEIGRASCRERVCQYV